jgi:hypothetical protein
MLQPRRQTGNVRVPSSGAEDQYEGKNKSGALDMNPGTHICSDDDTRVEIWVDG